MGLAKHILSFSPSVHHFVQKGELLLCLDPITFGCSHHVIQVPFFWCLLNPLVQICSGVMFLSFHLVCCFHITFSFLQFLSILFMIFIES